MGSGGDSLKIEEYLQTLPEDIMSGKDAELSQKSLRDMFRLVGLGENDVFYHLGCGGNGDGIKIALSEFDVKFAIGVDSDCSKIEKTRDALMNHNELDKYSKYNNDKNEQNNYNGKYKLICNNIQHIDISDATVVLFWFVNDTELIDIMTDKFRELNGARIITVWSPLPGCLPDSIDFPYVMCKAPFRQANDTREQLQAIFGKKCIDFVTAWEYAERYTKALGPPDTKNDRFLTIIQTLTIWINAWNIGVACGDKIPESISTYVKLMKMNFDIDFEYLIKST